MPLVRHAAHGVLMPGDLLADQEEGRLGAPLREAVEQLLGGLGPWAVVEGQRHIFLRHSRRLRGRGRQTFLRTRRKRQQRYGEHTQQRPPLFPCHSIAPSEELMRPAARLSLRDGPRIVLFPPMHCGVQQRAFCAARKTGVSDHAAEKHKKSFCMASRSAIQKDFLLTLLCLDQLDDGRLSSVAAANAGADDAGIAAIALSIGWGPAP